MTFADLRNDGFTVLQREEPRTLSTIFRIQKDDWNYEQIVPHSLISGISNLSLRILEESICHGAMQHYKEDHNG